MNPKNKRVIYDGINMSIKALTVFIMIGLSLMACLIWYGTAKGSFRTREETTPNQPIEQGYAAISEDRCGRPPISFISTKINQKFIDKPYLSYYNRNIVVTAETP